MSIETFRRETFDRDKRCMAAIIDLEAGPCYDRWGRQIAPERVTWLQGEADYVRLDAHDPRHHEAHDHIWLCPGHHRGTGPSAGFQWATSHRREERDWLTLRYQIDHGVFI